jgi:hypothetical protein
VDARRKRIEWIGGEASWQNFEGFANRTISLSRQETKDREKWLLAAEITKV